MSIKPLQRIIVESKVDGTQISRLPNIEEIINKINELVDAENKRHNSEQEKSSGNFVKQMTSGW